MIMPKASQTSGLGAGLLLNAFKAGVMFSLWVFRFPGAENPQAISGQVKVSQYVGFRREKLVAFWLGGPCCLFSCLALVGAIPVVL